MTVATVDLLIAEARQRQRRRRIALALVGAAALAGAAAYRGFTGVAGSTTVRLRLHGFGTPLPARIDHGPCPQGRTLVAISPSGSAVGCVLSIRKRDGAHGVERITQRVRETYRLAGGTIVTLETQTIRFAGDGRHTSAVFRGRVTGGTGRFAHAGGTVSGGGPGVDGHGDWRVSLQLDRR